MHLFNYCFLLFSLSVVNCLESSVIDLSHHNKDVDFNKVKKSGVIGVIHKATQGLGYTDPKYGSRKSSAESSGLLWGAYHFGTNQDGAEQAKHFLKVVDCGCGNRYPLLGLDIEENGGNTMSLENAEKFVNYIKEKTGKCPLIYGGHYLKQIVKGRSTVLTSCPLWLSQYSSSQTLPEGWSESSLWQHTDGTAGPNSEPVPGVGKVDKNVFHGSNLTTFWNNNRGTRS